MTPAKSLINHIKTMLTEKGFEIAQPFPLSRYNNYYRNSSRSKPFEYISPGNGGDDCLAILVGNTKSVWPHFTSFLQSEAGQSSLNPFDDFTKHTIESVLSSITPLETNGRDFSCYYSHEFQGNYPRIAMQVAGQVSGVAYYENEVSYLSIHPQFGTWFAFRCVIVFNSIGEKDFTQIEDLFKDPLSCMEQVLGPFVATESVLCDTIREIKEQLQTQLAICLESPKKHLGWIKLRDIPMEYLESFNPSVELKWRSFRYEPQQMTFHYVKKFCFADR